jgi:hypothetical protein
VRYNSQDRFVARQLDVHGKKWTFTGVFDGTLLWRRGAPIIKARALTSKGWVVGHSRDCCCCCTCVCW